MPALPSPDDPSPDSDPYFTGGSNTRRHGSLDDGEMVWRMTLNQALAILLLPALSFALLYFPALTRLAPALDSPYPKVDWRRRLIAGAVDASIVALTIYFFVHGGSWAFPAVGAAYVVMRDGIAGRSVGKFLSGLSVVELQTGRSCSVRGSVIRNLVFFFPGVNVAAVPLEAVAMARDALGQRLGDRLARTQVVEGFGAREVAEQLFRGWWSKPTRVRGRGRPLPEAP